MRTHLQGTRFKRAFVASFTVKGQWGIGPWQKKFIFIFLNTCNKTTMYHTLVLGHSIYTRMRDYLHSGHDTRLCPDFKLSTTTSVEICGQGGLTMTRLMANGGTLLNSIMGRVSKEPDIIFLQVSGNGFPRTAQNQRDAGVFSLQLLELASLLNNRYKAKRVVVGCILQRFSARRSRRGFSPLEVRQYLGWAQAVNTGLTEHSQKAPHITVWKHNAKFTFQESRRGLFSDDRVHLSTQGHYLLCTSIRGAMVAACHSLQ